jgi:pimeloyl-ACP methyl ester carboxylesterase
MVGATRNTRSTVGIFFLAVALWFTAFAHPAAAGGLIGPYFKLEHAYPDRPMQGPTAAKGAVIWNHGRGVAPAAKSDMLPFYVDDLRTAGWDVFRLERDWSHDDLTTSSQALREAVGLLRQTGYEHVVLAGQSYGAWISLMVSAAKQSNIDAVIATAPAAFGKYPESWVYQRNASELYPVLSQVQGTRVMLFLFQNDPYDPGERGQTAEAILGTHRVDHLVVDHPAAMVGHGAANYLAFANRFGPCIVRFVDPTRPTRGADCATDPVTAGNIPVQLPRDLDVAKLANTPAQGGSSGGGSEAETAQAALGIWYGSFANGREVVLAIEKLAGNDVDAIYAWGQDVRDENDGGSERRHGKVVNSSVVFDEPSIAKLTATPRPDGQLNLRWTAADGSATAKTTIHRLK